MKYKLSLNKKANGSNSDSIGRILPIANESDNRFCGQYLFLRIQLY